MHIRTVIFVIYHVISVPLSVLYIVELVLLRLRAEFSSVFYTLFFFGGVTDLTCLIMNVLVYQISFLPGASAIFENFTLGSPYWWILSIAYSSLFYLPGLQDVTNVLIAVDRFFALHYPLIYRNAFSSKYRIVLVIILAMAYSLLHCMPNIGARVYVVDITFNTDQEPIYLMYKQSTFFVNQSFWVFSLTIGHSCICLIIYCLIAISLHIQRWKNSASTQMELRMVVLGFAILLANTPIIVYQAFWFTRHTYGDIVYMILPWCFLIKTLSPPVLMLITNSQMRRELRFDMKYGSSTLHFTHSITGQIVERVWEMKRRRPVFRTLVCSTQADIQSTHDCEETNDDLCSSDSYRSHHLDEVY